MVLAQASEGHAPLWLASPVFAFLMRLVAHVGPPADVLLRLVTLSALPLCTLSAYFLAAHVGKKEDGGARSTALVAASGVNLHGALVAAAQELSPTALIASLSSAFVLLILRVAKRKRAPLASYVVLVLIAIALVAVEPLALVLVLAAALWAMHHQHKGLAKVLTAAGTVTAVGLVASGATAFARVSYPLVAQSIGHIPQQFIGLCTTPNIPGALAGFVETVVPALLVVFLLVATVGFLRSGSAVAIVAAGMLGTGLLVVVFRAPSGYQSATFALLAVPLFVGAAVACLGRQVQSAAAGPVAAILILSGLSTVTQRWSREDIPLRAVANGLDSSVRILASDEMLAGALSFYRDNPSREGQTGVVRLMRGNEQIPRAVARLAFGDSFGSAWLIPRSSPIYDLGRALSTSRVHLTMGDDTTRACVHDGLRGRFDCGGPSYHGVSQSGSVFDGAKAEAIYAPPLDDGILEIAWINIPLRGRLVGAAGIDDWAFEISREPVRLDITIAGELRHSIIRGHERGLQPFELDLDGLPETGEIVFAISAARDRGRSFFFDAIVAPARGDR